MITQYEIPGLIRTEIPALAELWNRVRNFSNLLPFIEKASKVPNP